MVGAILSMLSLLAAQAFGQDAAQAARAPADAPAQTFSIVRQCEEIAGAKADTSDRQAFERLVRNWLDTCRQAVAADGNNPRVRLGMARALSADGQKQEAVRQLRAAAARDDMDALFDLYDLHKSNDRRDGSKPMVPRAAAEYALRRAAELGHPDAMLRLAVTFEHGGIVKRDLAAARFWMEQAMARPPQGVGRADIAVQLGRLLAQSDAQEERARGLSILDKLADMRGDAQAELAIAIRAEDPFRARVLLEQALESHPAHVIAPLADMLLKGEGGPEDIKRAIALLNDRSVSDVPSVHAAKARLLLDGRIVERNLQRAVELLDHEARWDYATRQELLAVLAANPAVNVGYPSGLLYAATEAAELGEPGALTALIDLKLSGHGQFGDTAGGCDLAARAAAAGDAEAAARNTLCQPG